MPRAALPHLFRPPTSAPGCARFPASSPTPHHITEFIASGRPIITSPSILGRRHTSPYRPTSDASSRHHPAAYIAVRRRPVHGCPRTPTPKLVRLSATMNVFVAPVNQQLPGRHRAGVVDDENICSSELRSTHHARPYREPPLTCQHDLPRRELHKISK